MAEVFGPASRVLVEDARRDGSFLRVTWHPEATQLVVSHWQGSLCVAATRVPVQAAPELMLLLARALGDSLSVESELNPTAERSTPGDDRDHEPWFGRVHGILHELWARRSA